MFVDIGEIFWLTLEYEDIPNESKRRPAIIIDKKEDSLFILVSTTSQSPSDPPSYFDGFKIPIYNWRKIGLLKPSWGLGYRLIELTENELKSVIKKTDYIGRLSKNDLQYLIRQIELKHN
ncbi:MAG: type II toxin-antitoxin system PemK/MazF family toxin [Fermentimonas sp.]|jgi:mRNA interferase MazF|nr:type II toxin-antitoxin system PemK/MazF family toxin [Fermentimonas sp.]